MECLTYNMIRWSSFLFHEDESSHRDMFSRCCAELKMLIKVHNNLEVAPQTGYWKGWQTQSPTWETFVSTRTAQFVHHYCEMHALWTGKQDLCSPTLWILDRFIQTYRRCFAAVIINVGSKCPAAQGGKQRLSSGVQVVEESKSEQGGVRLTWGRRRNTWYCLS